MMKLFPIKSVATDKVIGGCTVENNAEMLAAVLNKFAKEQGAASPVVYVGQPIPANPSYSKAKDPQREMLTALLTAALAESPEQALAEVVLAG